MFLFLDMFSLARLLGNVLSAKINDSMIIRNNTIIGSKNVPGVPQQNNNAVTFRTTLKGMKKNPKNMKSRKYKSV